MTAIATFPLTPVMRARIEARENAVDMARTIIRGKERHAPDDLRLACETLMTYGDQWDWVPAYQMMRQLDAETPQQVIQRHDWRRVAVGGVLGAGVILGFVWLALQAMENV